MNIFTKKEIILFKKLNTPAKVQDFLNTIPINFEHDKIDRVKSPLRVMRENNAHCIEGAILGAYILSLHGYPPLIMHLKTIHNDFDHVVSVFKKDGLWGALSKTNHAVLRYRDPVYKNIRELVMSFFHEYFLDNGVKTLRQYSKPLNLNIFEKGWEVEDGDLWGIDEELDKIKHYDIAPKKSLKTLRLADPLEIQAGKITEYQN
ncbi:hypothetical protein A3C57_01355 [Candidatus Nomurabacteria bacterium RIFCSPHIGHO2_02_FULL_33_12]|uniref:Transglutaminase-like domain-containing protein n=1 Tax=Candidatus Nomurabacteria bacterium RIFCSPLOWO2_01_FULL_33_17 TaxID=1801764 RepID=A0A1F6WQN5_9BACT|nr:MAG: hypothetical protein A3C57_01355 [Candidatus Nomurabacteria bacterium RIFCSPHIGHO2_02_FULL_33_12]OGI84055.1 MAG: hypothetical protein A2903_01840 [Candidatus Nomurabacteria bacterium RIFCSPLOWO2_01_FULL_33_17]